MELQFLNSLKMKLVLTSSIQPMRNTFNSLASCLLTSISTQVSRGLSGCMTATSIWHKFHRDFSSSSITRIIHLYDLLKPCKLVYQSMCDYLTEIQTTCDSLANYGHPIKEMQQISIILNGVKGQFDNIIVVIHVSRNPYDIALVSSVLSDVESRQTICYWIVPCLLMLL